MPLTFNICHLGKKDLRLQGDLPADELDLDLRDDMVRTIAPLNYDLEAEELDGAALIRGNLQLPLQCTCVRCLKEFNDTLKIDGWTCHLPLKGEDATPIVNDLVNLTPYIREDILLEFPRHPVCNPECPGLKQPNIGKSKKSGAGKTGKDSTAWAELDKLKL